MSNVNNILNEAKKAKSKYANIDEHMESIALLRTKGFSWRDISDFLRENGIEIDHTKLSRTAKANHIETNLSTCIPTSENYIEALNSVDMSSEQKKMLLFHYKQPNRTVTYSQLAESVGQKSYRYANTVYGNFAKTLCTKLNFKPFQTASGRDFFGSVIGLEYAYANPNDSFQLVMHHELSKAIEAMNILPEVK